MSRVGKLPIAIPDKVKVTVTDGELRVKGPLGELSQTFRSEVAVRVEHGQIVVEQASTSRKASAFHGLYRALFANMVEGVTRGFSKSLEIHGVGYRAGIEKISGEDCVVFKKGELGFSHPIYFALPSGISAEMDGRTKITIKGIDKALVGLVAAKIRGLRPPDVYKGKGVRYSDEVIRTKVGKSGKK